VLILRQQDLIFSLKICNVFEFAKQIDNMYQTVDKLKSSYFAIKAYMETSTAEIEEKCEKLYLLVVSELAKKFDFFVLRKILCIIYLFYFFRFI